MKMRRQERENMIHYLMEMRKVSQERLMLMTDEDVEHLYTRQYGEEEIYNML
ncbi:BH0509 family protein [Salisediminibacterium halotolerans]|uniref:Fur-regulated basic protein A n=1 Tax=Salisediminibacterium halotolerans TaxID=517425 RepID=A0A1H9WDR7_9BACI|nr:hypothetical protein SAMN05444126_13310 [Salisediminibacterium haloalkalitolerans]